MRGRSPGGRSLRELTRMRTTRPHRSSIRSRPSTALAPVFTSVLIQRTTIRRPFIPSTPPVLSLVATNRGRSDGAFRVRTRHARGLGAPRDYVVNPRSDRPGVIVWDRSATARATVRFRTSAGPLGFIMRRSLSGGRWVGGGVGGCDRASRWKWPVGGTVIWSLWEGWSGAIRRIVLKFYLLGNSGED